MMKIDEARQAATEFLRGALQKEGAIVKMSKAPEGWEIQVEVEVQVAVIEPSEFIKALGIPTVVRERNLYEVKLDDRLDVVRCERLAHGVEPARKLSKAS